MHPMLRTSSNGFFFRLVIFVLWCSLTENVEAYNEGNDYGKKGEIEKFENILNQQILSPQNKKVNHWWLNLFGSLQ